MHRAVLLEVLQQISRGCETGSGSRSSRSGSEEPKQQWHMVSSVQQLKLALSRLRQLHLQLLKLQETAEKARDALVQVRSLSDVGLGVAMDVFVGPTAAAAGGAYAPTCDGRGVSEAGVALQELCKLSGDLEQGVCAAYGRFLLAVADAVQPLVDVG
jgi:hypothetical protein